MPRSKQKLRNRRYKRRVRPFAKNIQASTYIQKSRLVRFSDYREFLVKDSGTKQSGGATKAVFPSMQIGANSPTDAFTNVTSGTWESADLGTKGAAVHGITSWVTNQDGSSALGTTPVYRHAQCLGSNITVSAQPAVDVSNPDTYQDVCKVVLQKATSSATFHDRQVDGDFNSASVAQMPFTKTAHTLVNWGGTARGCTLSGKYSFKAMNQGLASSARNDFYADAEPAERDYWQIGIIPANSYAYTAVDSNGDTAAKRCAAHRVCVKIDYIVLLSEPQTTKYGTNTGDDLGGGPALRDAVLDRAMAGAAAVIRHGLM